VIASECRLFDQVSIAVLVRKTESLGYNVTQVLLVELTATVLFE
jgi:hypothetical protein